MPNELDDAYKNASKPEKKESKGFEPLADGKYVIRTESTEFRYAKTGTPQLVLEMIITAGPRKGAHCWKTWSITVKAIPYLRADMETYFGIMDLLPSALVADEPAGYRGRMLERLIGIPMEINLKNKSRDDGKNEVQIYFRENLSEPGQNPADTKQAQDDELPM